MNISSPRVDADNGDIYADWEIDQLAETLFQRGARGRSGIVPSVNRD
jgi:hypothetical protein